MKDGMQILYVNVYRVVLPPGGGGYYKPPPFTVQYSCPHIHSELDNLENISMLDFLSVSDERYANFQKATQSQLGHLQFMILDGWPEAR